MKTDYNTFQSIPILRIPLITSESRGLRGTVGEKRIATEDEIQSLKGRLGLLGCFF